MYAILDLALLWDSKIGATNVQKPKQNRLKIESIHKNFKNKC